MILVTMGIVKPNEEKLLVHKDDIESFELKLNPNKVYDVGIDQSHTCTGVCIRPLDKSFLIVIEVLNVNAYKDLYRTQLKYLLEKILVGHRIRYFIMEQPLGHITGKRNRALSELRKFLNTMKDNLNVQVFTDIPVGSWRHGLMPSKKEVDGDRRSKETVVTELIKLFPQLEQFLPYSNTDYDGIESVGILLGYIARHQVEDGTIKIVGPINTAKKAIACFKYVDVSSGNVADIVDLEFFRIQQMSIAKRKGELVLKAYNNEHNLHGNAKMCLVDSFSATIVTDELDVLSILIRGKVVPKPNHLMLMAVIHERLLTFDDLRDLINYGFFVVRFQ